MKFVYKPSQILRMVKAGTIADPQPRHTGKIFCEAKHHRIKGETESPQFWENGSYVFCPKCDRTALARVEFAEFEIDLTGERKKYPLYN